MQAAKIVSFIGALGIDCEVILILDWTRFDWAQVVDEDYVHFTDLLLADLVLYSWLEGMQGELRCQKSILI